MSESKTVLITGGAGFIGRCLVGHLVSAGYRVINIDSLTYAGHLVNLPPRDRRHLFLRCDIRDQPTVEELLERHEVSSIINLAAESHVDRSIDGPLEFVRTNVEGTVCLLDAFRNYLARNPSVNAPRFIQVSTDEVYGSLGSTGRFTEESSYAPNSPYAASKAASDHFVSAYGRTFGIPVITTHCSNNYGPYQHPEKLIPVTILRALNDEPILVYGTGENVRDWIHVDDHCRALIAVLENGVPSQVYNIGANIELTNAAIVQRICNYMNTAAVDLSVSDTTKLIQFVDDRPGHDFRYSIDASKLIAATGWKPLIGFDIGLGETIRWYLEHQDWIESVTDHFTSARLGTPASAATTPQQEATNQ